MAWVTATVSPAVSTSSTARTVTVRAVSQFPLVKVTVAGDTVTAPGSALVTVMTTLPAGRVFSTTV